jgi:hypothetical protein
MSDDYLKQDFPWDDESQSVDLTPPPAGRRHFAHLRLYIVAVGKSYTKGDYVTVPSVAGGQFDEKDSNGDKMFKGWTGGGSDSLYVLVATQQDQNGQDYQIIKQYASKRFDKRETIHLWAEKVLPALKDLSDGDRKKLTGPGLYVEFDDLPTGQTFTDDDNKKHDIVYWGNYKVHKSKEALTVASDEFFNRVTSNGDNDIWPSTWVASGSVEDMIAYAKTLEGSHTEIAKQLELFDAKTAKEEPVNIALVLSKCLDIPEPMIKLEE